MIHKPRLIPIGKMSPSEFVKTKQTREGKFVAKYNGREVVTGWVGVFSERGRPYHVDLYNRYGKDSDRITSVGKHEKVLDVYQQSESENAS
jgi:hypothetical protein